MDFVRGILILFAQVMHIPSMHTEGNLQQLKVRVSGKRTGQGY